MAKKRPLIPYKVEYKKKEGLIPKIYGMMEWRNLRKAYLFEHPLCEECLKEGILKPTEEIHHIKPISTGKDELEMKDLAFDPNNLVALCRDCHHKIHNKMRKK